MVAVFAHDLIKGEQHGAEKGRVHIRRQNADRTRRLRFQSARVGVDAVAQLRDRLLDRFGVLGADVAAVDIL